MFTVFVPLFPVLHPCVASLWLFCLSCANFRGYIVLVFMLHSSAVILMTLADISSVVILLLLLKCVCLLRSFNLLIDFAIISALGHDPTRAIQ